MDVRATGGGAMTTKSGNCGCGCGGTCGCESRCCDLECLVRPNFFCGQLLTDADLGATVEWARTRFALSRYRHGWGVVCGLDVTCASPRNRGNCCDDTKGPTVWLNPGYAIDCCGNDLVVCEPMPVDLTEFCAALDDPCEKPVTPKTPVRPIEPGGGIRRPGGMKPPGEVRGTIGEVNPSNTVGDDRMHRIIPGVQEIGKEPRENCFAIPRNEMIAVDLMLRYHEDLSDGQRPMFRGDCSDVTACEYTRVLEKPCVHGEIGDVDRVCDTDEFEEWLKAFLERWAEARNAIKEAVTQGPEALLRFIRRHPPYKFCLLEDVVCCLVGMGQQRKTETELRAIAFLLYLDWLLHELQCPCPSCRPDRGVPIARVLLRRGDKVAGRPCRVVLIEAGTPYRRPLERDECRPRRRGRIDLVPYLWEPFSVAADRLGTAGVELREMKGESEDELLGIYDRGTLMLDTQPGRTLRAFVMEMMGCRRIVAFAADVQK